MNTLKDYLRLKLKSNSTLHQDSEAYEVDFEEEESDAKDLETADKEQTVPTPVNGFDEAVDDLVSRMKDRVVLNETDDQGCPNG